ncbi:MAG: hypothetical protein ACE5FH_13335 [Candidatus Zixiibacteriota bacterium]
MLPQTLKRYLALTIVGGSVFLGAITCTDTFRLRAVTIDGEEVDSWKGPFEVLDSSSVLRQPLDSLARRLLTDDDICRVDIRYNLPHGMDVSTNRFEVVCFLLDRLSGQLYGLDRDAREVSLERAEYDWERPVLTTLSSPGLYKFHPDRRVQRIVAQLNRLHNDQPDLYRIIEEIDLGNSSFLRASLAGLSFRVRLRSSSLGADLNRFIEFTTRYQVSLDSVRAVDARFDNMIICSRGGD